MWLCVALFGRSAFAGVKLHTSRVTRRSLLVCAGVLLVGQHAATAAPAAPANSDRVRAVLGAFEKLSAKWADATLDCRFGEVKRDLLSSASKQQLLEEASTFATFNKEKTMDVMCKRSTTLVRALVDGPETQRVEGDLRRLVPLVSDESADEFLELIDSWSQQRSAASAAAYTAMTGDLSSVNVFKKGTEDGGSENLLQAQRSVAEAARVLRRAVELLG
jgi:hypothetical protein